jgi:predicted dehydrogenase
MASPGRGEELRSIHVGVGTRGAGHLRAALESGYWRPVALVDVVPEYLTAARELTGLPAEACFGRVEDALAAVASEAVVVTTPVTLHAGQIRAALEADRHVLTEKCFTVSLAEAERCVALAEQRDRKLMVVQNARLEPSVRTLARIVAEETYGPLGLFLQSFFKARGSAYNRSPHMHLWQQSVHELDSLLSVVQRPLRRVWGLSNHPSWCDWPSPSTIQVIAEFEGGVSGSHVSTSNARSRSYEFRLECAEATVVSNDRHAGTLRVRWGPQNRREETLPPDRSDVAGLEHHPIAQAVLAGEPADRISHFLEDLLIYRDFAAYITAGREPQSSGRRNLDTMRFLDAVQRSTEEGRPIELS